MESLKGHMFLKPKLSSLDATDRSPSWPPSPSDAQSALCRPHPHSWDNQKGFQILLSVLGAGVRGKPLPG